MKARREMFSISDMASLEWGEITLEDFVCQKSGGACHLPLIFSSPEFPGSLTICNRRSMKQCAVW